jgi:hypothetical protein
MRAEVGYRAFQRPPDTPDGDGRSDDDAKVFSGSHDANARASAFTGPGDATAR